MIYINIKNKQLFYKTKKFKYISSKIPLYIPIKSQIEYINLTFDKNKLKYSYNKGIVLKQRKSNLFLKTKGYIKIPIWNPKIKNIKLFN